jgi:hypothetical protein
VHCPVHAQGGHSFVPGVSCRKISVGNMWVKCGYSAAKRLPARCGGSRGSALRDVSSGVEHTRPARSLNVIGWEGAT